MSSYFHFAFPWSNLHICSLKQCGYKANCIRVTNRLPCSCSLLASVALFTTLHSSDVAIAGGNFRACTEDFINYPAQVRQLTMLREEIDWICAVHVTPQQQALRDLDRTYADFFNGIAKHPRIKRRGVNDSFRFQGRKIKIRKLNANWSEVRLPKIGWVRYRDSRPLAGTLNNVTVNLTPSGWHIRFNLAIEHDAPATPLPAQVGIDRGVAETLALSTGEMLTLPSSLAVLDRKKRKLSVCLLAENAGPSYTPNNDAVSRPYRPVRGASARIGTIGLRGTLANALAPWCLNNSTSRV